MRLVRPPGRHAHPRVRAGRAIGTCRCCRGLLASSGSGPSVPARNASSSSSIAASASEGGGFFRPVPVVRTRGRSWRVTRGARDRGTVEWSAGYGIVLLLSFPLPVPDTSGAGWSVGREGELHGAWTTPGGSAGLGQGRRSDAADRTRAASAGRAPRHTPSGAPSPGPGPRGTPPDGCRRRRTAPGRWDRSRPPGPRKDVRTAARGRGGDCENDDGRGRLRISRLSVPQHAARGLSSRAVLR